MFTLLRFICALLAAFLWHTTALASPTNASFAYLVDAAAVDSASPPVFDSYRSFNSELSLGFRKDPVWIRVTLPIREEALQQEEVGIRISPYQLTNVALFQFVDGRWLRTDAGAKAKLSNLNPCLDNQHCFKLNSKAAGPSYVRIQTPTILTASFEVLDLRAIRSDSASRLVSLSSTTTIASSLLLLGIFFAASEKSRLSFAFLWLQSTVFLYLTGSNGLLAEWFPFIPPDKCVLVTHVSLICRTAAFGFLMEALVGTYQSGKTFDRLIKSVYAVQASATLMIFLGYDYAAFQVNLLTLIFLPPIALFGVLKAQTIPIETKRVLLVGCAIFIIVLFWGISSRTNFIFQPGSGVASRDFADWKMTGLGVALVLLWFLIAENARRKFLQVNEAQRLELMISEAKHHEKATKERGMLIDMMTHEIKNPLSTIRFAVSALQKKFIPGSEESQRSYRLITSIDRIDSLLEHVALSNKLRNSESEIELERLGICNVIEDVIADSDEPERVELYAQGESYRLLNRAIFRVAIENLVGNAQKYSDPGTTIQVSIDTISPLEVLRITVSNHLLRDAIPDLSQLFDPYYRHAANSGRPGMGLGLSLVKSAVERLDGIVEVRVVSDIIHFEITFP
jgi:two-component system, sensor histidine kinase LadS